LSIVPDHTAEEEATAPEDGACAASEVERAKTESQRMRFMGVPEGKMACLVINKVRFLRSCWLVG
jgi:hypothetical protein